MCILEKLYYKKELIYYCHIRKKKSGTEQHFLSLRFILTIGTNNLFLSDF